MMLHVNTGLRLAVVTSVLCLAVADSVAWPAKHIEAVKELVNRTTRHRAGLMPPGIRFDGCDLLVAVGPRPRKIVDDPAMVPYLIEVLRHGPDWQERDLLVDYGGILPQVARCAAAINLGALKAPEAYEPLLAMLKQRGFLNPDVKRHGWAVEKNAFDISISAARGLGYLGDKRAVPALIEALGSDNKYLRRAAADALRFLKSTEAVGALMRVCADSKEDRDVRVNCLVALAYTRDMRALPTMMATIEELGCSERICQQILDNAPMIRYSSKDRKSRSDMFPELGATSAPLEIWKYWLEHGQAQTAASFKRGYQYRVDMLRKHPEMSKRDRRTYAGIESVGIAALPYCIEKIEHGEDDLIPAVAEITGDISVDAKRADVLKWWEANKARWLIPWGKLPSPSRPAAATQPAASAPPPATTRPTASTRPFTPPTSS